MLQPVAEQTDGAIAFQPKGVVRPRVQIEQQIRAAILSGELPPGFRLQSEAELSRLFGVSRNTIREGLRSLETQGLIEKLPGAGGGSFVQRVDQQSLGKALQESVGNLLKFGMIDVDELASVREYLEVPSARLTAVNCSEEDLQELRGVVERQQNLTTTELGGAENRELNLQFHNTIARASGNNLLNTFVHALHRVTEAAHYVQLEGADGLTAWEHHVDHHVKILHAIEQRDPDAAEEAVRAHLQHWLAHIMPMLQVAE
jgi:GntR family transcriptional regulator, transcriptional repressor for pyruvate dehydrogenase complex